MTREEEDKDFDPEEEETSESSDSELDTDEFEEALEKEENLAKMSFQTDAQPWPSELSNFSSDDIEPARKKDINVLYKAFQDSQNGKPSGAKHLLLKVNKLFVHMNQKPPDVGRVDWFTKKCEELVPQKRKRKSSPKPKSSDSLEMLSPPPLVDLSASGAIGTLSESIIPQPSTSQQMPSESGQPPNKKSRMTFDVNNLSQAFYEGRETCNGFRINQHPKMKKKKSSEDPDEKDVTEPYGLDSDTHICLTEKVWANKATGTVSKKLYLKFLRKYTRRDNQKLDFYSFYLPMDLMEVFDLQRKIMEEELTRKCPEHAKILLKDQ